MMTTEKISSLFKYRRFGKILLAFIFVAFLSACDDDESPAPAAPESNVRIIKVDASTDEVTLKNFGEGEADISGYFFCRRRNYSSFASSTHNGSDLVLTQNEEITFTISIDDNSSDVAIYNTSGAFTSSDAMVDFMQFGGSFTTNGREDVAVSKGIWTAGDFVADGSPYTYNGDGDQNGVAQWAGTEVDEESSVRLVYVNPEKDIVILKNLGTEEEDVSSYFFCRRKSYTAISTLTPISGDMSLAANEEVKFSLSIEDASSDVALYANNSGFASSDNIIDFMQFGADVGSDGRADVAVSAGIWTAGEFVDGSAPFNFDGIITDNGASFWSASTSNVRIVSIDPANDKVTLKNFGKASQDLTDYWFCGRKSYTKIGTLTPTSGDLVLEENEEVEFTLTINDNSSDLAIYNQGGAFTNSDAMVDFVMFGDDIDNAGRESVAVAAGIWTENDYVNGVAPFTYGGDGDQNGASQWSATSAGVANVRILTVDATGDKVTLKNFGTASQNISGYVFCRRRNYTGFSSLTFTSGNLILAPNEEIEFSLTVDDVSSDVAIYNQSGAFTSADAMVDFMQFGGSFTSNGREDVAVAKGIWTAGDFAVGGSPFNYTGNGTENGVTFW